MFSVAYRCFCSQYRRSCMRQPLSFLPFRSIAIQRYLCSENVLIRVIDENGQNLGMMSKLEAKGIANDKKMKLKEILTATAKIENSVFKLVNSTAEQRKSTSLETKTIKSKELTMKSQIEEQDLKVKAKKLQTFLDKGYKVTLKITKPRRSNVTPREAYEKLIAELSCTVKLPGTPKESENFFRCTVLKNEVK